jgi:hydroxymethylpyrimidine pyrophosphatase-like HAD family hydrolase
VHIHLSQHPPDKGAAVQEIVRRLGVDPQTVATIGDAPNDAGLWVPERFGLTVGTAQVRGQEAYIAHLPEVLVAEASDGWLELAQAILAARRSVDLTLS